MKSYDKVRDNAFSISIKSSSTVNNLHQKKNQKEHEALLMSKIAHERDKKAFQEIFDLYASRVYGLLIKLNTSKDEAEDITQDVMSVIWLKANLFDSQKSSLSTWVFRVARNKKIDALRKKKPSNPIDDLYYLEDDKAPNIQKEIDDETRRKKIISALEKLPQEQRFLIEKSFFGELSHAKIAKETDIPLGTIKSRIRLAFTKLRHILEADGLENPFKE